MAVGALQRDAGDEAVRAELRARLGTRMLTEEASVQAYRHDEARTLPSGTPGAVVLAESTDDVRASLDVARRHGVPVVPRGAGSGLSGGANASEGCLVICVERMNSILELDRQNLVAVVQPGVINADLRAAAAEAGLAYPPDPASYEFSSLGGNVATNAGGLCCAKYGVTRDSVLGLTVMLADGTELRLGRRTLKGVTGYDMTALFVGSEGTLGVITEATLRLRPAPPPPVTVFASFAELASAGRAASAIRAAVVPAMLELLDATTISAIEAWKRPGLDADAQAVLLVQSDGGAQAAVDAELMAAICRQEAATLVTVSADVTESAYLMSLRRMAYPALQQLGATLLDDVAVPCGRIPELIAGVQSVAARSGLTIGTFGHAGDGNMHPTLVYDGDDAGSTAAAMQAFADIVRLALDLGGTSTGEHGVGMLKRDQLAAELGPDSLRLQMALKAIFDPTGLLNPGKVFPDHAPQSGERPA